MIFLFYSGLKSRKSTRNEEGKRQWAYKDQMVQTKPSGKGQQKIESMLLIYCCVTDCPRTWWLNATINIYYLSKLLCGSGIWAWLDVSSLGSCIAWLSWHQASDSMRLTSWYWLVATMGVRLDSSQHEPFQRAA